MIYRLCQCRAGSRRSLAWSSRILLMTAKVSMSLPWLAWKPETNSPGRATLEVVKRALEDAGVEFIDENGGGPGVRLRKSGKEKPRK